MNSRSNKSSTKPELKAQLTLAGYSHVMQVVSPGEYAVRGGLIDLFPMGSAGAVPGRSVRRRDRQHPHLRPRQPAQPLSRFQKFACCPAANFRWTTMPERAVSQTLARTARWRSNQEPHLQGHRQRRRHLRHRVLPAAVSSRTDRDRFRLPRRSDATVVLHGELEPAFQRFWQDTKDRYRLVQRRAGSARACRRSRCF